MIIKDTVTRLCKYLFMQLEMQHEDQDDIARTDRS